MTLRSRLWSALRHPFGSAPGRSEPPAQGGGAATRPRRESVGKDAAFDAALREAFQSAVPPEPARLTPRRTAEAEPPRTSATGSPADAPGATIETPVDAPRPGVSLRADPRAQSSPLFDRAPAQGTVDPIMEPRAAVRTPGEPPAGVDAPGTPPAGKDDPMRIPESVTATTDDFFDGLLRRIERRP